jgi:hypothetical protein
MINCVFHQGRRSMTRITTGVLLGLLLSALFSGTMRATTRTAASCNSGDVQAAMNAAQPGDTVVIPAGTCTWTSQVSWSAPSNTVLQGQTVCSGAPPTSCTDSTVIVDNYASNNALLAITPSSTSSATFRLYGITFQGGTGSVKQGGVVAVGGTNFLTRIDHNHFNLSSYSSPNGQIGVRFSGWVYGVMDHNLCDDSGGVNECVNVWMDGYGGGSY